MNEVEEQEIEDGCAAISGEANGTDTTQAAELLLDICSLLVRAAILMHEASEDDWKVLRSRLQSLQSIYKQLPTEPTPKDGMGFQLEK